MPTPCAPDSLWTSQQKCGSNLSFALDAGRPAIIEPGNKTLIRYFGVKLSSTEARRFIAASAVWPMVGVLL
jgi:hypothetical protein